MLPGTGRICSDQAAEDRTQLAKVEKTASGIILNRKLPMGGPDRLAQEGAVLTLARGKR